MKEAIRIKGNNSGLTILLNEDIDFDSIKKNLYDKLSASRKFFGHAKISVKLKGKNLTEAEQNELIDVIHDSSDLEVLFIEEENHERKINQSNVQIYDDYTSLSCEKEELKEEVNDLEYDEKDDIIDDESEGSALFHKGTLRSGQEIVTDSSVIIMGNVHHGAKVHAKGNIIIIGRLSGSVHAGSDGNENAFVVALNMSPTQIRIGNVFGRSEDTKQKLRNRKTKSVSNPRIAYVEDQRIIIEHITQNIYNNLSEIQSF